MEEFIVYDDTSMPLWPVSDAGLRAVAHFYNKSISENNGSNEAVVFAKILTEEQKDALVWDVEKGVYDTRPWKIFGEGPVAETTIPLHAQGFNEGKHAPYTAEDIRFVVKGDVLYAHVLAHPEDNKVVIKSLSEGNPLMEREISSVSLVGSDSEIKFNRNAGGLVVELPEVVMPNGISLLLKIS